MISTERLTQYVLFVLTITIVQSCSSNKNDIQYAKWYLKGSVFTARSNEKFDNVAVKDPSIVYFNKKYHLFYTAKGTNSTNVHKFSTGCAYVNASTIEELNQSERYSIDSLAGRPVIAPQIFYFEPHKRWYLIAHTPVLERNLSVLKPIYLTNKNIDDISGWSAAKEIETGKSDDSFWIDFWIICDDEAAYLFYSDQKGSVFRLKCGLKDFPDGFSISEPELALCENHLNEEKSWKMFEAIHIYYVKKEKKYMALLEGAYQHPVRKNDVDARNRFIFGMTADSLDGIWTRVEKNNNEFLAEAKNLLVQDGRNQKYTLVSHPELIRSGYNQKLEIKDYKLAMIFQSIDGSDIPDNYNYNELPLELVMMHNY
jgi:hypothetical protein